MAILKKIDTKEVRDIANNILTLVNEYESIINKMFRRFNNVTTETKEWIGNQAEKYFSIVAFDKEIYMNIGESIKEYANKLIQDSELIDDTINNILKEENNDYN